MGQYYDDSHLGFWAVVTVATGTPTLQTSFNVASITDTALGQLTVTLSRNFSTVNWAPSIAVENIGTTFAVANVRAPSIAFGGKAVGSLLANCLNAAATTNALADPQSWAIGGFGTQ